ncbi:MAG: hypothetical protein ABIK21_04270 [bacterium]
MKSLFLIVMLFLISSFGYAHLCHDPFRPPDRLVLMPEKKLIRMEKEGEFRIYVENTFSSVLRDLRLIITSPAFDIETVPASIDMLVSGERSFYLVKLKLREGFKPGDYPLRISVEARSAELRASIEKMEVAIEEIPELKEEIEEVPQEVEKVVIKVEKLPFWEKPYFYIILILLFLGILIWRKIK